MKYTFVRRTTDLPEGIDRKKSFEAATYIEALQQSSEYWFNNKTVID